MAGDQRYATRYSKVVRECWMNPALRPVPKSKSRNARADNRFRTYRQPDSRPGRIVVIQLSANPGLVGPLRMPLSTLVDEEIVYLLRVTFALQGIITTYLADIQCMDSTLE